MRLIAFIACSALAIGGCASSRPAETGNRTPEMRLYMPVEYGRSTTSAVNVVAYAEATCLTTDCSSQGLRLSFANVSRQQAQLRVLPVVITAGSQTFNVPASDLPRDLDYMPVGPFLHTLVRTDFVDALASERDVMVRFGSTAFTLSFESRAPLRRLLQRMRDKAASAAPPAQGR